MTEWLSHIEVYNTPHFMRGAILGLIFWIAGMKWIQPRFGIKAAVSSLAMVLAFSVCWEIRDQVLSILGQSDPFDVFDILFDVLGWGFVQLVHLSVHRWDK